MIPKFWVVQILCCNHPEIQTKRLFHSKIFPKCVDVMANSVDLDWTAPIGAA